MSTPLAYWVAAPPDRATLLSLLGPWPWYLIGATVIAFVLLVLLDLPFRRSREGAFIGFGPRPRAR